MSILIVILLVLIVALLLPGSRKSILKNGFFRHWQGTPKITEEEIKEARRRSGQLIEKKDTK
jgi:hypothetical protein